MDALTIEKIGELLVRKSAIMQLMEYIKGRAKEGDIKRIWEYAQDVKLSDIVLEEREER